MKRIIAIIISALILISLVSCKGGEENKETEAQTSATEETTVKAEEEKKIDFSFLEIKDYIIMNIGDEEEMDGAAASSRNSVATVQDCNVKAVKSGVSLIAVEKDGNTEAVVCCVLEEGQQEDRSAGSPQLFESGKTFVHTAPIGGGEYVSSNESIVSVESAPTLAFNECGYAVVTVANASRPFFYSFIVYDRAVEE